jgi:iduronate 2-sulfatase
MKKLFSILNFFPVYGLVASSLGFAPNIFAAENPVNILFIAADDLNCDISPYGNSQVKTPHLDRLFRRGVRFDNAYCQQPLCAPSRASVMTGKRPNTIRCYTLQDQIRDHNPDIVTLSQFFKNRGYYSGRVGKIFHYGNPTYIGTNGHDDPTSWSERFNPKGIDKTQEEKIIRYPGGITGKKGNLGISMAWWAPESEDSDHTDGKVADHAIAMIEAHKDEPFFIAAGFFNPHCPYVAPKKYFDLYNLEDIALQDLEEAKADLADVPGMAIRRERGKNWPYAKRNIAVEEARQCKLAYYATVSFVDAQIGRILDALEENDLTENTVIVFWSDHGYFLGEKGLWFKRKAFERSVRAPLIVSAPGGLQGRNSSQLVELIDLYPTLVDYAGFEIPDDLEGKSLRPLMNDPDAPWKTEALSQVHHGENAQGYSIRTERWRYTEWNQGEAGKELYDHHRDPEEVTNLAQNPQFAEVVESLQAKLRPYSDSYVANPSRKK